MPDKKTLLIVENEAVLIQKKTLESCGYKVITAHSGKKAIEKVRTTSDIDLILMDINLGTGKMDGIDCAEIILKETNIPVLFISSNAEPKIVEKMERISPYGYVVKGSGETVLKASIEMALKLHEAYQTIKKREESLEESFARYALVVEGSSVGIWDWDVLNKRVYFSPAWKSMRGYTDDEIDDREENWSGGIHPDDAGRVMMAVQDYFEQRTDVFEEEYRVRRKDGSYMWILDRGKVLRDSNGHVIHMAGAEIDITKRKLAEEALKRSEERFRVVQEMSPDGFTILHPIRDEHGNIVDFTWIYHNEATSRVIGYDIKTITGRRLLDLFPGHSGTEIYEAYKDVAQTGIYRVIESIYRGETITTPTWFRLVIVSMGEDIAILTQDITERKQMEEKLVESEKEYRELVQNANSIIIKMDREGNISFFNDYAQKFFGYASEEILGKNVRIIVPSTENPRGRNLEEMVDSILSNPDDFIENINENVLKNGDHVWISWRNKAIKDVNGNIVGNLAIGMDITERKRAEDALRENEARLGSILRVAPVGIGTVVDRVINQANDTLCEMTGYAQDELLGQNARLLYPTQDDFEFVGREKYAQIGDHGTGSVETRWLRKDGTIIDVLLSSTPLDLDDLQKGVTFIALDITERKRAEESLRLAHDELEKRVRERTAELNQAYEELQRGMHERELLEFKLRQSQKMEAIGTLAGGIAHDFNNILAAVLGFTEMAIEDVTDRPLVERNLRNVIKSAMRARDLVKQILAFSRKVTHERTPLSLTPLLEETVQLLRASIPTTVEIRFDSTASSDTVLASPVEVQQVLMNLATNASLAMQVEGGTMEITLTDIDFEPEPPVQVADMEPREYVQLVVKDTGIGMSHEVMRRAFEPFFTTREPGTGTGMGLAVVYGIVKDLQGMITVESEPGVGSVFRVLLPKVKTRTEEELAHIVHIRGGRERILFVDDEPMLVDWGQATLERMGYTVTALTDSTEALKTFSSDPRRFDLVITDHTMSGMTGLEVSKELLKIRPDIPIILCTGHSDTVSPEIAKEVGIRKYLMKPLAKQELATAVRQVLDTRMEE